MNSLFLFKVVVLQIMGLFGPPGECDKDNCGCGKYKKERGFTCKCGHNVSCHDQEPTLSQQIQGFVFMQHLAGDCPVRHDAINYK